MQAEEKRVAQLDNVIYLMERCSVVMDELANLSVEVSAIRDGLRRYRDMFE
jgi:hypothetical protein